MTDLVPHDDDTRLTAMMEESRRSIKTVETTLVEHDRRIYAVETGHADLRAAVNSISTSIAKLTDLQAESNKQGALHEQAIVAIKERTDTLAEHMEKSTDRIVNKQEASDTRLDALDAKVGKHDTKWNFLQAIGLAAAGVGLSILAQHLPR